MTEELEKKLVADFPSFFRDYKGNPMQTGLAFGCQHGDGWFKLFYELNAKIDKNLGLYTKEERPDFYWTQVKEKFGTARWYYRGGDDIIDALVSYTEGKTAHTCETCGEWGTTRGVRYLYTSCDKHAKPEDKDETD